MSKNDFAGCFLRNLDSMEKELDCLLRAKHETCGKPCLGPCPPPPKPCPCGKEKKQQKC